MKNDSFSQYHPVTNFLFFVIALGTTMFIAQPVCLLISFLAACTYLLYLKGRKGLCRQLGYLFPLLLMMAVINPLFNHEGLTILCYLPNDNPITLEAVVYGLFSAVLMGASILWFQCCNEIFTSDKIIYLFGRVVPALSLLISMTLRFVPRFKTYLQNVVNVQKGFCEPRNTKEKIQQAFRAFSATVSWAMEQSIVSADSMKSRGFGLLGRTAYSIYSFEKRDRTAVLLLCLFTAATVLPFALNAMEWTYYPTFTGELWGWLQMTAYCCYAAVLLLPLTVDLMEDRKWNSLRSEI